MADDIAAALVERGPAACSTASAAGRRTWGGVVAGPEVVEPYPHEVPCTERFDESDLLGAFGEWATASIN